MDVLARGLCEPGPRYAGRQSVPHPFAHAAYGRYPERDSGRLSDGGRAY